MQIWRRPYRANQPLTFQSHAKVKGHLANRQIKVRMRRHEWSKFQVPTDSCISVTTVMDVSQLYRKFTWQHVVTSSDVGQGEGLRACVGAGVIFTNTVFRFNFDQFWQFVHTIKSPIPHFLNIQCMSCQLFSVKRDEQLQSVIGSRVQLKL